MAVTAEEIAAAPVLLEVGTLKRGPWRDVEEVAEANRRSGSHWFSDDAKRFFSSRVGSLTGGRFFVSSEARGFDGNGRGYTVRLARADATIDDVTPEGLESAFLSFDSGAGARKLAESLEGLPVTVRRLEGRPVVYAGPHVVGSRYFDAAGALQLAGELTGVRKWEKPTAQLEALWTAYRALGEVDGLEVARRPLRRRIDRLTARLEAAAQTSYLERWR